jgi:pyruvate dehydrogenase E1 component alpha subunit
MGAWRLPIWAMGPPIRDKWRKATTWLPFGNFRFFLLLKTTSTAWGTSTKRHAAGEFYRRGEGFDIKGEKVNGMDIFAVREAASRALEDIRAGNGPYILEMVTYRYRGHSMSDPQKYRAKEEVEQFKTERDPIEGIKKVMSDEYGISEDDLKQLIKR